MKRPVRTTLVWAFLSGFVIYPALGALLTPVLGWPMAAKLVLWAELAVYALLLARWSNTRTLSVLFPLLLLLGAALWPYANPGFFVLFSGVLIWIRSGICFRDRPLRAAVAELLTVGSGISMAGIWLPGSLLQWGLGIWLFGLVQCLYFYIVPCRRKPGPQKESLQQEKTDPFDQARHELEQILSRQ